MIGRKRIKDLTQSASSTTSGDYLAIDHEVSGTRKILVSNLVGDIGGYVQYVHLEVSPKQTWTVNHNQGVRRSIMLTDLTGNVIEGDINVVSDNAFTVNFNGPQAGYAIL